MKEEPGSGDQVNIGTGLKQLQASGIMRRVDFSQGMFFLRKKPFFLPCLDAICIQIDQDHFVLGNVYSKENTVYSQCEQSSDSKNCKSNGQVTRS